MKKNEDGLTETRDTIEAAVSAQQGHPKELRERGEEKAPEEIMAENVTNLLRNNPPIEEAQSMINADPQQATHLSERLRADKEGFLKAAPAALRVIGKGPW